jgi:DNA mismatch repair protein MSH5
MLFEILLVQEPSLSWTSSAKEHSLQVFTSFCSFVTDQEQFYVSLRVLFNLSMWKNVNLGFVNLTDGAGLFCGVIKHLLNRGRECPIVFAATHFHEALNEEMLSPTQLPISFVHMAVLLTTGDGEILNDGDSSVLESSNSQDRKTGLRPSDGVTYLFKYVSQ